MALSTDRPGYAQVEAVSRLAPYAVEWLPFMRDVVKLPLSMLAVAQTAVRANYWKTAIDPIQQVRDSAEKRERRARRKGIRMPTTLTQFEAHLNLALRILDSAWHESAEALIMTLLTESELKSKDPYPGMLPYIRKAHCDVTSGNLPAASQRLRVALDLLIRWKR